MSHDPHTDGPFDPDDPLHPAVRYEVPHLAKQCRLKSVSVCVVTRSRKRRSCLAHARHERAEHQHRCPHGPHEIIGCLGILERGGVDQNITALPFERHPHVLEYPAERCYIGQARDICYPVFPFAEKHCSKDRQSCVLGPADDDLAM